MSDIVKISDSVSIDLEDGYIDNPEWGDGYNISELIDIDDNGKHFFIVCNTDFVEAEIYPLMDDGKFSESECLYKAMTYFSATYDLGKAKHISERDHRRPAILEFSCYDRSSDDFREFKFKEVELHCIYSKRWTERRF